MMALPPFLTLPPTLVLLPLLALLPLLVLSLNHCCIASSAVLALPP